MKVKYLSILFLLFLCEFANGQVPGMPKILGTRDIPQAFTLSAEFVDFSSALVKAQVLDNGRTPVTQSGIIWGTSMPTISSATANGTILTRSGSGAFTSTITLNTLSPRPSSLETYYILAFATNAAGTAYGDVITYEHGSVRSPSTGRIWLRYNLGASNIPTTVNDRSGMGDLYQWGRASDGHQIARPTTSQLFDKLTSPYGQISLDVPANAFRDDQYSNSSTVALDRQPFFIVSRNFADQNTNPQKTTLSGAGANTFGDWLINYNNNLWQGVNGVNNPCPVGFRLPTISDFQNETPLTNSTNAFASFLKLPNTGYRDNNTNANQTAVRNMVSGYYWTSSTYYKTDIQSNLPAYYMGRPVFIASSITTYPLDDDDGLRAQGMGVRCIKD